MRTFRPCAPNRKREFRRSEPLALSGTWAPNDQYEIYNFLNFNPIKNPSHSFVLTIKTIIFVRGVRKGPKLSYWFWLYTYNKNFFQERIPGARGTSAAYPSVLPGNCRFGRRVWQFGRSLPTTPKRGQEILGQAVSKSVKSPVSATLLARLINRTRLMSLAMNVEVYLSAGDNRAVNALTNVCSTIRPA